MINFTVGPVQASDEVRKIGQEQASCRLAMTKPQHFIKQEIPKPVRQE